MKKEMYGWIPLQLAIVVIFRFESSYPLRLASAGIHKLYPCIFNTLKQVPVIWL